MNEPTSVVQSDRNRDPASTSAPDTSSANVIPAPEPASATASEIPYQIPRNDGDEDDEEEEEDDYEYEDEDEGNFGFLVDNPALAVAQLTTTSQEQESEPATIEQDDGEDVKKEKWREPTKQAVNMSLRAEKEKTGGKRRLAQDLYRIMNQDTEEAGFSLEPSSEDAMDKWTIKLFKFDEDSNLAKDMLVLGLTNVELEMCFPDQYPFEPPFVRVVRPRFRRQTGFVMNGALCMELLTNEGWNPINDIESVIVSIRSLLTTGDGRLEAATNFTEEKYEALLTAAQSKPAALDGKDSTKKRRRTNSNGGSATTSGNQGGAYSISEAQNAYAHLSDYHKKKGWDTTGWWAKRG